MLDIQKLAAEMSLTCITTYKLDALKAVRRRNESNDNVTVQSSEPLRFHEEKTFSTVQVLNPEQGRNEIGRHSILMNFLYKAVKFGLLW